MDRGLWSASVRNPVATNFHHCPLGPTRVHQLANMSVTDNSLVHHRSVLSSMNLHTAEAEEKFTGAGIGLALHLKLYSPFPSYPTSNQSTVV